MKNLCIDLKEHATKITNFEKKEMISLTKEEKKIHRKKKVCYICKKQFSSDDDDNEKSYIVRDHCHYTGKYRGAPHNIINLRYETPKEIPVVFHNGSTYDYHFIIKELADESEGQFECLGENTEKYITFSVPIKKGLDNGKSITYKITIIDSFRFMSNLLSSVFDNLSEGLHCDTCIDFKSCLDYISVKHDQLIFRCFDCKKTYKKDFNEELIKRFAKFTLLVRKGVYPYEYIDSWERFDETSLADKEAFYSSLSMEDTTDVDYRYAEKVLK